MGEWEKVETVEGNYVTGLEKRRTYLLKCTGIKPTHKFYAVVTTDSIGKARRHGAYEALLLDELTEENVRPQIEED